jgi:hypoxanthine phosphoribosyltransferase
MVCVGWSKIEQYSNEVIEQIRQEFSPDWVVGIGSGGLLPAVLISKGLNTPDMTTLFVSSYHGREQSNVVVARWPDVDLTGRSVLVVDDIASSGNTLKAVVDAIRVRYHPQRILTATLVINADRCQYRPDFFAKALRRNPDDWIVFPWDRQEYPEFFDSEAES